LEGLREWQGFCDQNGGECRVSVFTLKSTGTSPQAALVSFEDHLAVLSEIVNGDHQAAADRIVRGAPSAVELVDFQLRHGLGFFLATQLQDSPVREVLPEGKVRHLEAFRAAQIGRQTALVLELEALSRLFQENGVEFILLKGPYLAHRYYEGVDRRFFGDLDLLIKPECLERADELLRGAGYERLSRILISSSLVQRFTHGFDYKQGDLRVDLHWSCGSHVSYKINYEELWRQSQEYRIGETDYRVLSDEYALLFHLVSYFEDLDRGAARLKNALDIWHMLAVLDAHIDWAAFFAARREEGVESICRAMLSLCMGLYPGGRRYPRVLEALDVDPSGAPSTLTERQTLIEANRGSLRSKLWASSVYDCRRILSFAWWTVSLPFRVMVYNPAWLRRMLRSK